MLVKKIYALGATMIAVVGLASQSAHANSPDLKGQWLLTYFAEPDRVVAKTICFNFKRTNTIQDVTKSSGTWRSVFDAKSVGEWIQLGDHVYWWGRLTGDQTLSVSFAGNLEASDSMGGENYVAFNPKTGKSLSAGNFDMNKANCAAG
jgi:hypothetical protein